MQNENFSNPTSLGNIPDSWTIKSVESLCLNVTTGGTPSRSNPEFFINGTINWVKTQELKDCNIHKTIEKITSDAIENSAAKIFPKNTVLMAMYGEGITITGLGILRIESATNQACCAMIVNPDVCDYRFLFYALKFHRKDFLQLASGGAQRNLSGKLIRNFSIKVPPVSIQHAIAHILGSFDDKIELNRQMNETLEAMARAIFKSWFVDFDPVRAKAEGRDTGLPLEIAALFPDGFEVADGREVPRGWGVGPLSSTIDLLGGGTPKTSVEEYWNGDIPWFSVADAPSDSDMFVIDTEKHITQAGVENSSTNIFPVGTTIITARGTVGKLALAGVPMTMNQSCYGIKGVKRYPDYYIHFLLKRAINELQQNTHGTVFETITRQTFDGVEIIVPPAILAQKFDVIIQSHLEKIRNNLMESRTLAQIRDALLPKLMSGEIRVDNFSY
jgi:type I restriction enzyme S subunit